MADLKALAGRTVVLAGVGTGGEVLSNGRATALAFARAGANLVLLDHSEQALSECAAQVGDAEHITLTIDATDEVQVQEAGIAAIERFGRVDVLHNNLGITQYGHLPQTTLEDFQRVMSVNVQALYLLTREFAPRMREQGAGVITNVSSIASTRYLGIASPLYDMSKAAVNALTRYLAAAYGPFGVRANAMLLGMMDTPMARTGVSKGTRAMTDVYDEYSRRIPLRKLGSAENCADVAVFLASDHAAYLNGLEIPIDGGLAVTTA